MGYYYNRKKNWQREEHELTLAFYKRATKKQMKEHIQKSLDNWKKKGGYCNG